MTEKWALWLDDLRNPHSSEKRNLHPIHHKYIWARDVEQAVYFVKLLGIPEYMALDHDLGLDEDETRSKNSIVYKETGMKFLMWLEEYMNNSAPPKWKVHSDNPAGAKNMESFMKSWEKAASQGAHVPSEFVEAFEYETNVARNHDIFKVELMGKFPAKSTISSDDLLPDKFVLSNPGPALTTPPTTYKSLEMVRDRAVATLVKAEKPASRQERLCRQEILDLVKARPHTAKQIREALILKGWDSDEIRRQIAWLWDNGYINVDLNQIIIWNKGL